MKEKDITIGNCYDIKVGKNTTAMRMMKLAADGGWEAVTLSGNKTLVIKSADRLVGIHKPKATTSAQGVMSRSQPNQPANSEQAPDTVAPAPQGAKKLSALDAAAKVLSEANAPLNCKQMVEAMMARDYWKPSHAGKTPANTLHAAIGNEIKTKGAAARFEKVGRGQFVLRSVA